MALLSPQWATSALRTWFGLPHSLPQVPSQLSGFTKGPTDFYLLLIWHMSKQGHSRVPKLERSGAGLLSPDPISELTQPGWASEPLNLTVPALTEKGSWAEGTRRELGPIPAMQGKDQDSGKNSALGLNWCNPSNSPRTWTHLTSGRAGVRCPGSMWHSSSVELGFQSPCHPCCLIWVSWSSFPASEISWILENLYSHRGIKTTTIWCPIFNLLDYREFKFSVAKV